MKIVRDDLPQKQSDYETSLAWVETAIGDFLREQRGKTVTLTWRKLRKFIRSHRDRYPLAVDPALENGSALGKFLHRLYETGLLTRLTPAEQNRTGGKAYTLSGRVRSSVGSGKGKLVSIPLENIEPPKHMLRRTVGDLSQLMASIRTNGVLVPPTVRPIQNGKYEVVDGHRRIQACINLGSVKEVTCFVRELDDTAAVLVGLAQNIDRQSMTPLEVAEAIKFLMETGLKVEFIAEKMGKTTRYIRSHLILLSLPENERMLIHTGKLSIEKALKLERYIRRGRLTQEKVEGLLGIALEKKLNKEDFEDTLKILTANPEESEEQAVERVIQRRKTLSVGYHEERRAFIVANGRSDFRFECLKCHQEYFVDWKEKIIQSAPETLPPTLALKS